jgi:hypothetical protein
MAFLEIFFNGIPDKIGPGAFHNRILLESKFITGKQAQSACSL